VLGAPVSVPQVLAHVFFLQDILGYESLSAGLWFVCINFQLCVLFALLLWLRDALFAGRVDVLGLVGWGLSVFALFYAYRLPGWDVWAVYFFPYFFVGVVVWRVCRPGAGALELWLLQGLFVLALLVEWRWRLVMGMVSGGVLLLALRTGFAARWPTRGALLLLGRISYSLFLVHFPVLLLVSALWTRLGWVSPLLAGAGLLVSFAVSVVLALVFYRWVEVPAGRVSRLVRGPVGGGVNGVRPLFSSLFSSGGCARVQPRDSRRQWP
jgi:peptidoglycan/LPS O-acetylase OafA/YrhL